MSLLTQHPGLRWTAPVAVLALVGGGVALTSTSAQAESGLTPKTAQQLLGALHDAKVETYSGTVRAKVDLGLGALTTTRRTTDFQNLADGESTLSVWADGPTRQRVALLGDAGEADLVRDGRDVWTWNAQQRTATHTTLPATKKTTATKTAAQHEPLAAPTDAVHAGVQAPKTPAEAAQVALAHLDPTTAVTTNGTGRVAGRPTYQLSLVPRTDATLVRRVLLDVDAETSMPLRVRVSGTDAPDTVDIGFTDVSFDRPDAALFRFTPPAGATVTQHTQQPKRTRPTQTTQHADHAVRVGTGWATVTVTRVPASALAPKKGANDMAAMLAQLPKQSGAWGRGTVVEGTLASAVLTTDGRLAVGAVPASALFAALQTPAAKALPAPATR